MKTLHLSENDLKPCPFCGSDSASSTQMFDTKLDKFCDEWIVQCGNCLIGTLEPQSTELAAIEIWNRRANEAEA